jgi:transposase-like protein
MKPIPYDRHRFPAEVISHAVWLYFSFTLSLRDGEEMMAARGVEVSDETIRCSTREFGQAFAQSASVAAGTVRALAFGRDGGADRWSAHVPMARGR